ncbi:MAG TPA: isoprenylcysteine carboxylmethyltransferase family protein [Gemmatimonadales bacterium]|nr:isoprenylcysteine carboxylmethyltransferase family protein [Gemmatimonadales bacterium]
MSDPPDGGYRWPPLVRYGNFVFRSRNALFPAVLLLLFFAFKPVYPRGNEGLDNLLDAVGVLIALAGQALRIVTIGHAYIIRGGRNRRVYADGLVTEGMFAHSRNPLYLGNIMILFGLFVIHNSPWVYAIGVPFFLLGYCAIVAAEEGYLRAKFGEAYRTYAVNVPRWIPRFAGLHRSLGALRFNWWRVMLKEYTSTYVWTAGAVLLLAMDTLSYHSYNQRAAYLNWLWGCLALLTSGWGAARYIKKSRRRRSR